MTATGSFHVNDIYYSLPSNIAVTDLKFTMTLQNVTPLTQMYWAFDWWFADSAVSNGYTGLQPIGNLAQGGTAPLLNLAVWNATSADPASGSAATTFGNEGVGERISRPTPVVTGSTYSFDLSIQNGMLTETMTDASGKTTLIGSIPAPSATFSSAYGLAFFSEYYGVQDSASLALGEAQISNVLVNGQAGLVHPGTILHAPDVAADALPFIEATGPNGYYDTSTGATGQNLTLTLNSELAKVDGAGVGINTVKIGAGNGDLTGDSFTNIHTIDGGGQTLTLTPAQIAALPAIVNASIAMSGSIKDIAGVLDSIQAYEAAGTKATLTLLDPSMPSLAVTASQVAQDSAALHDISGKFILAVSGDAASIANALDQIESLASAGTLTLTTLTGSGFSALDITAQQLISDHAALINVSGNYTLSIAATGSNLTIAGLYSHGNVVQFSGAASQFTITAGSDGTSFTVSQAGSTDHLSGITALQFSDGTDFVASLTPVLAGGISSAQITDLYAAVFARTPDVPGLAYYEAAAATNPSTPITTYAQQFLSSPEYTANIAHAYAQSSAGDAQFILDTYTNLLHRGPETGAVEWYQANVIAPLLSGQSAGTAGYSAAELAAHAAILADFSQSAEFLGDVQISAAHPADAQHWLYLI